MVDMVDSDQTDLGLSVLKIRRANRANVGTVSHIYS